MLSCKAVYLLCVVSYSVVSGKLSVEHPSLFDKDGQNVCLNLKQNGGSCKIHPNEDVTLRFNLTADQFYLNQPFNIFLGNKALLPEAEICYDFIQERVVVISAFTPLFCFIQASEDPYAVEVTFKLPPTKEKKLKLRIGSLKTNIGSISSLPVGEHQEVIARSIEDDDNNSSSDDSNQITTFEKIADIVTVKLDFISPIIVDSGVFHIGHLALLDDSGKDTCTISSNNTFCKVQPKTNMTLYFTLAVDNLTVRQKFSLTVGNVTVIEDVWVCYDFDSKRVYVQTKDITDVCFTSVRATDQYIVQVPFEVPPYEGQQLIFNIGPSRGLLMIHSDDSSQQSGKSTSDAPSSQPLDSSQNSVTCDPKQDKSRNPKQCSPAPKTPVLTTLPPTTTTNSPTTTTDSPTTTTDSTITDPIDSVQKRSSRPSSNPTPNTPPSHSPTPYTPSPYNPNPFIPPSHNPPQYTPPSHSPTPYTPPPYNPNPFIPPSHNPAPYTPPPYNPAPYTSPPYNPAPYTSPPYNPAPYTPPPYSPPSYNPPPYTQPSHNPPPYTPPPYKPPQYTPPPHNPNPYSPPSHNPPPSPYNPPLYKPPSGPPQYPPWIWPFFPPTWLWPYKPIPVTQADNHQWVKH